VLWLLEELALPYTLQAWKRTKEGRAPKGLRDIHPLGKAPVVVVDGEVLAESGAIVEALVALVPDSPLRPPPGTPEARRFTYFLHFAEGSLMPPLVVKLLMGRLRSLPVPARWLTAPIANGLDAAYTDPELQALARFLDDGLREGPWFCGAAFTAADVQLGFAVDGLLLQARRIERAVGPLTRLRAWQAACHARPAWQRATAVGGPPLSAAMAGAASQGAA
jgi:glutathione S-transferase